MQETQKTQVWSLGQEDIQYKKVIIYRRYLEIQNNKNVQENQVKNMSFV